MVFLALGLLLFLGVHSVRILADPWRTRQIERIGEKAWKGAYTILSLLGFGLLLWGYGASRAAADWWPPPGWAKHAAALVNLVAFILITAAYIPANRIKARLGHPMVLGTAFWSIAHLAANGRPGDTLLFGAFLLWSLASFHSARRRDRAAAKTYPVGTTRGDILTIVIGIGVWALFAFALHAPVIGVRPF